MARKHGDRYHLLIYERMWRRWAWTCILIVPASVALWWFVPRISIIYAPFRALALVPALISLVILAYAYLARRLAWVQCRPNHLHIQTPFYPLVVSYSRIKGVRPKTLAQTFDPAGERAARRRWLRPYWGKTVLVVELSRYPFSKAWLRLWFSPYLLAPDVTGFVFLVEDWMALSRQLDEFRTAWATRRAEQRRAQSKA
ncbi:MAG: hypothetical protein SWK90_01700 [Chloroflexota bacterium]|nr:hypothetical protein [Chloroflexota bacterium]